MRPPAVHEISTLVFTLRNLLIFNLVGVDSDTLKPNYMHKRNMKKKKYNCQACKRVKKISVFPISCDGLRFEISAINFHEFQFLLSCF